MSGDAMKKRPKEQSAGVILQELRREGAMTKVELASRLQLSFSTISNLCKSLEETGFIVSEEGSMSTGGRRPSNICLNPAAGCFAILTFSYPIDAFRLEIIDFSFTKILSRIVSYDDVISLESLMDRIKKGMLEALGDCGRELESLFGICLAIPGVFDKTRETTFTQGKKLINHIRLRERMKELFSTAVVVENDANLIALGYGVEANGRVGDMLILYFTHGIGLGILSGGKVLTGRSGYAGEVGHLRSSESDKRCGTCGATSCLETVATLRHMLFDFYAGKYEMREILGRQDFFLGEYLAALRGGDPEARRILERTGRAIGDVIGSLIDLFNPEMVGVCGNSIPVIKECIETVHLSMRERSFIIDDNDTPIAVIGNHEELMTHGATEMIFTEWLNSNQLMGNN